MCNNENENYNKKIENLMTNSSFVEGHGNKNQESLDKHNRISAIFADAFNEVGDKSIRCQNLIDDNPFWDCDGYIYHLKSMRNYVINIDYQCKTDSIDAFQMILDGEIEEVSQYIEKFDKDVDMAIYFNGNKPVNNPEDIEMLIAWHNDFTPDIKHIRGNYMGTIINRDCRTTKQFIYLRGLNGINQLKNIISYAIRDRSLYNANSFYFKDVYTNIDSKETLPPDNNYEVEMNIRFGKTSHKDPKDKKEQMIFHFRVSSGLFKGYTFMLYANMAIDEYNKWDKLYRRKKMLKILNEAFPDKNFIYESYEQFKDIIYDLNDEINKKNTHKRFLLNFKETEYGLKIINNLAQVD